MAEHGLFGTKTDADDFGGLIGGSPLFFLVFVLLRVFHQLAFLDDAFTATA